ncbi:hypothetical protein, partial [Pseudoalteromonas sp. GABNS16H]|uniref:hypothetical protein n=2 Tax=unclassified Pseudoalteromonas TaxID=194690 RepID=UPI002362E317
NAFRHKIRHINNNTAPRALCINYLNQSPTDTVSNRRTITMSKECPARVIVVKLDEEIIFDQLSLVSITQQQAESMVAEIINDKAEYKLEDLTVELWTIDEVLRYKKQYGIEF